LKAGLPSVVLSAAVVLAGCPDDAGDTTTTTSSSSGGPSCELPYLGDPAQDPVIELFYYGADELDHPCTAGGPIDIIEPPQGGRVLFVGVRATNIDPCGVQLGGTLRDTTTSQIRFDSRTINLADEGDGFGRSASGDIASYANIPVCHNTWSDKDIFDVPFRLEVELRDRNGKIAQHTLEVVPVCGEQEPDKLAQCLCICDGDYVLGDPCDGAGGAGGGA
jgi:hypothetical protein